MIKSLVGGTIQTIVAALFPQTHLRELSCTCEHGNKEIPFNDRSSTEQEQNQESVIPKTLHNRHVALSLSLYFLFIVHIFLYII